jgi:16S rRNA (guanine966-N2)-methyltransferase
MRIVAGTAKGIRLAPVPGGTRPLSDRAREGLFSSLGGAVAGAQALDLFAGTGAVGIEALSRGAAHGTFVDSGPHAIRAIRENLDRTGLAGRATVLRRDARTALRAAKGRLGPFGLVTLDPPYAIAPTALDQVLAALGAEGLVTAGALVALTRPARAYTPVIPVDWRLDRQLSYGDAVILVFRV